MNGYPSNKEFLSSYKSGIYQYGYLPRCLSFAEQQHVTQQLLLFVKTGHIVADPGFSKHGCPNF